MKVLVTGAEGFVGGWLVRRLTRDGHDVTAACRRGAEIGHVPPGVATVPLELQDDASVRAVAAPGYQAVVHLAAVASGGDARQDPGAAWDVNAAGTARLAEALAAAGVPRVLLASTAEVYGRGAGVPRVETDPLRPCSPYAASKLGAEIAGLEVHRRTGLPVIVARAFPHTGRGQDPRFVVPAFAKRLLAARRSRAAAVEVGNLEPVRDILHVSDVVDAYVRLLADGVPGEVYNVASGEGVSIGEVFDRLQELVGVRVVAERDARLTRAADIEHLVGDSTKLRAATGWAPQATLDHALREVVDAQAD